MSFGKYCKHIYISYTIALKENKLDKSNGSMFIAHALLLFIYVSTVGQTSQTFFFIMGINHHTQIVKTGQKNLGFITFI